MFEYINKNGGDHFYNYKNKKTSRIDIPSYSAAISSERDKSQQ